ncbi:hypothetical protein [Longispora urticae]
MKRRLAAVAVCSLVVALAAGCGSGAPDPRAAGADKRATFSPLPGGEPKLDPAIVASADPRAASYPLRALAPSATTLKVIKRAATIALDRCMRQFGFPADPSSVDAEETDTSWRYRYGLWIEAEATEWGYLPPTGGTPGQPSGLNIGPYTSGAALSVVGGSVQTFEGRPVPAGGCAAEAQRAVYGTTVLPHDDLLGPRLDKEALSRALQDSRVVSLTDQWRTCMRDAGFSHADPMAPFSFWLNRRGSEKTRMVVSAEEKTAARADVACKRSTGLLGTTMAADIAYQRILVDRNIEALRAASTMYEPYLGRANEIIARG